MLCLLDLGRLTGCGENFGSGASKICRVGQRSDDGKVEALRRAGHQPIISDPYENTQKVQKVGQLILWWLVFFFSALAFCLCSTTFSEDIFVLKYCFFRGLKN